MDKYQRASSCDAVAMARALRLTGDPDADKLLAEDPFALLVGLLLDQHTV